MGALEWSIVVAVLIAALAWVVYLRVEIKRTRRTDHALKVMQEEYARKLRVPSEEPPWYRDAGGK